VNESTSPSGQAAGNSMGATAMYRARVRGCLLGGAVGDALGYAIEFTSLDRIRATHGRHGVTGTCPAPTAPWA
jgi:ADP-ribosylglycohydrolase